MVVLLALGAASLFGVSSVLMHSKAYGAPADRSLRPGLVTQLAREPVWLAGAAAQMAGFATQATALRLGSIVLVQMLGPTSLLVALPLAARSTGRRMRRSEWLGAMATVSGLGTCLAVAAPGRGRSMPTPEAWSVLFATALVIAAGLVAAGRRSVGPVRSMTLGTAAGVVLAATAALTKVTATRFNHGLGSGVSSWEPYVLAVVGLVGILLMQSSFQGGAIEWSLPALTVTNPAVSLIIGATAFHETITVDGPAIAALVASLAVTATGVVLLGRSPALAALHGQPRP
jgi:drug/metabolite transporter (DMT)-like permease